MDTLDTRVRLAAFQFVQQQQSLFGDAIPRDLLVKGFDFEGTHVPLLSPEGIFKPRILPEVPLSFTTVPIIEGKTRPYEDEIDPSGLIR
jgi:putative restriction endonuclease